MTSSEADPGSTIRCGVQLSAPEVKKGISPAIVGKLLTRFLASVTTQIDVARLSREVSATHGLVATLDLLPRAFGEDALDAPEAAETIKELARRACVARPLARGYDDILVTSSVRERLHSARPQLIAIKGDP